MGELVCREDKTNLEKIVEETITWLDQNAEATSGAILAQKKKLEDGARPIISKLYEKEKDKSKKGGKGKKKSSETPPPPAEEEDVKEEEKPTEEEKPAEEL